MKKVSDLLLLLAISFLLLTGVGFSAPNTKSICKINLNITYGNKSFTEREYRLVDKKTVGTFSGKMIEVNFGEPGKQGRLKVQITPEVMNGSSNSVTLNIKAWETRYVYVNGKSVMKPVVFVDQVSKVMVGLPLAVSERIVDRDIVLTITPTLGK